MSIILTILRTLIAFLLGFAIAFALVIGVELFSSVVHPLPTDFGGTQEEICQHVAEYPTWVLGMVVVAWGAIGTIATWSARNIGNVYSAAMLAVTLIAGVGVNLSMLPYALWFKVVMLPIIAVAIAWGGKPWIVKSKELAGESLASAS